MHYCLRGVGRPCNCSTSSAHWTIDRLFVGVLLIRILLLLQIVFHDLSGRWSFSININDKQQLKCINSEHISSASTLHPTNHGVYQHCFSSSLFYIRHLEQVTIRSLYEQRNILLSPEFTFWGLIKIS